MVGRAATVLLVLVALSVSGCFSDDCPLVTSGRWSDPGLYAALVAAGSSTATSLPPTMPVRHTPSGLPNGTAHLVEAHLGGEHFHELGVHWFEARLGVHEGNRTLRIETDRAVDRMALRAYVEALLQTLHADPEDRDAWWTTFAASERPAGRHALTHSDSIRLSAFQAKVSPDLDRVIADLELQGGQGHHTAGRYIEQRGGWWFSYHVDSRTWHGASEIGPLTLRVDVADHGFVVAPQGHYGMDEERFVLAVGSALADAGLPPPPFVTMSQAWCPPD